jgi:hypothetical protein
MSFQKGFKVLATVFSPSFYKFLWRDKVTGEILTNSYEDGGLKMIDITLFCQALKNIVKWVWKNC